MTALDELVGLVATVFAASAGGAVALLFVCAADARRSGGDAGVNHPRACGPGGHRVLPTTDP